MAHSKIISLVIPSYCNLYFQIAFLPSVPTKQFFKDFINTLTA